MTPAVRELEERSDRRFGFVLVALTVALGLNLVSLVLVFELRGTVNTNSAKRQTQIAAVQASVDANTAALRRLLRGSP